jgi:hypothetical protein
MGEKMIANKHHERDENNFEKRVKECLKLSGGKRMRPDDAPWLDVEW